MYNRLYIASNCLDREWRGLQQVIILAAEELQSFVIEQNDTHHPPDQGKIPSPRRGLKQLSV